MPITKAEETALIEAVREIARVEIMPRFRALDAPEIDTKSGPEDLVTVADRAAEMAISAAVARILPAAAMVGEEGVSEDAALIEQITTASQCVVVDPIDGTWNYANGLAIFGVMLAVVESGQTQFGFIYDPSFDDWIWARRDGGAWLSRPDTAPKRLTLPTGPIEPEKAAGFASLYLHPRSDRLALAGELATWGRVQSFRCSAHEYRLQVQNGADFCLNYLLNPWDHAAGALIYEEAGGVARLLDGRSYAPTLQEGRLLTARSEELWQALAARLSALSERRETVV